jgi:hypothetical protein
MGSGDSEFPRGFGGHRRAQATMGLRLTPAERLRWLEETMGALRRWQGRARPTWPPSDTEGEQRDPR